LSTTSESRTTELLCILNGAANSSGAEQQRAPIRSFCEANGRRVKLLYLDDPETAVELEQGVKDRHPVILAAGGDGTLNAVAAKLVGSVTALGALPLGTLNHFSKDLGIPQSLELAIATALGGSVSSVDVGDVNGWLFLNNSSIGVYPSLVRQRKFLQHKGFRKGRAFVRALFSAFWRYPMVSVQVEAKGREISSRTPFVFIGNNRYELDVPHIGARASLTRGVLWVCQAPEAGRFKLLRLAMYAMLGGSSAEGAIQFETTRLIIHSPKKHLYVATDGEVQRLATPLSYQIKTAALRVMVPVDKMPKLVAD
jgi:diacylglycerol kinase family enzyme